MSSFENIIFALRFVNVSFRLRNVSFRFGNVSFSSANESFPNRIVTDFTYKKI